MIMKLFDLHCDTATGLLKRRESLYDNSLHVSLKKAEYLDAYAQIMAIWTEYKLSDGEGFARFFEVADNLENEIHFNSSRAYLVTDFSGIQGAIDTKKSPFILAVDKLGDPGNFGTILRTAKAAGLREFWFTAGSADAYQPKVIRSSLAAQFSMNLREFADLDELKKFAGSCGFDKVFLTDPHYGESCFDCKELFDRSVVVIGSEAHGIGSEVAGNRVTIPMPGNFESLNAAQAATIVLFEHVRRLTSAGGK